MPFIIRGVKLWGIDSVTAPAKRREFLWTQATTYIDFNKLSEAPEKKFKIKTITASGYQALAAFLYASNLLTDKVNHYMWKIMNSITYNNRELTEFERKSAVKTRKAAIFDIQEQAWSNKYDFFG